MFSSSIFHLFRFLLTKGCSSDEFRCSNGDCVRGNAQCNGIPECSDRSDEADCGDNVRPLPRCSPSQFRCESGQCVSLMARCNGYTDCLDSSDEKNCGKLAMKYVIKLMLLKHFEGFLLLQIKYSQIGYFFC